MPKPCTVTLNVDWAMLHDQKLLLLEVSDAHPALMGLVHMIDSIQDQAHHQGCDVQWLEEDADAND